LAAVTWAFLLLLGLVLLTTLLGSRRPLEGKAWLLLRSLFPAWRFFEEIEPGPELRFRFAPVNEEPGEWQPAIEIPARGVEALFFNPNGNLALAQQSLVEQLASELDGCAVALAPTLVPYRLVQELIKRRIRERGGLAPARYQFRLDWDESEPAFVSEAHEL
jgi:hypothetical protein